MTTAPLKTCITSERQRYVDSPVFIEVSKAKPLALALAQTLPWTLPGGPPIAAQIRDVSHYERTPLRWMAPDGQGGLQPQ